MTAAYLPPYYANLTLPTKHKESNIFVIFVPVLTSRCILGLKLSGIFYTIFMSVVSKISCAKNYAKCTSRHFSLLYIRTDLCLKHKRFISFIYMHAILFEGLSKVSNKTVCAFQ